MKTLISLISFAARHTILISLAMITGCVLWTFIYFLLLAFALLGGHGVGSPLAYPAGVVAIMALSLLIGFLVFVPASGIGTLLCHVLRLPRLAAIPVVFGIGFLLSYLIYWGYLEITAADSMPPVWTVLKYYTIILSAPLALYWWLTEGPVALIESIKWSWRKFKTQMEQRRLTQTKATPSPAGHSQTPCPQSAAQRGTS
mgnify:CR=1 FL=1